jgi:uncharacterized membrane protein YbhN (UPF0104 family)
MIRGGLLLSAVAAAAILLPRALPPFAAIRDAFGSASWNWVAAAALLQFGSIGMLIRQQRRLLGSLGVQVGLPRMAAITYSGTALAVSLPAGAAFSAGYAFRQFKANGATPRTAGLTLVLSGLLSIVGLVIVFGGGWAVASASRPGGLGQTHPVAAALLLAVALGLLVVLGRLVDRAHRRETVGPATDCSPWVDTLQRRHPIVGRAVRQLVTIGRDARTVRPGDLRLALAASIGKWLLDGSCLYACTLALGVGSAFWEVLFVYFGVQVVRQIPLTPGGMGLVEVALVAGLVSVGAALGPATAAMIVYRMLSCWLLIPVGFAVLFVSGKRDTKQVRG